MQTEAAFAPPGAVAAGSGKAARPLRVLMVLESNFTQKGGGGAESQVRTVARQLRRIGHQATVVTPLLPQGSRKVAERCYGLPVGRIRYPYWRVVGASILCLRFAMFLWRHRRHYDAWHVHIGHHLGAVACLLGPLMGKPVVVKISGWWELERGILAVGRKSLFDLLARRWLKRADAVQAISTRISGELARVGFPTERTLVLPNAVDTSRFAMRTRTRAPGAPFTAVFVGRLSEEKGVLTLIDAWARSFAGRSNVRLLLVGGGPTEPPLRARVDELGIAPVVEFLGHRDRVEEVLAEADLGLLPSRIEGLSNTLLEYMASGLPAIASRVSGSEDFVVPGKNGWLFPVADVEALATCLREAEALPPAELAAMGRQARADVEAAASLDLVVGRLLALYRGTPPRSLQKAA